MRFGWAEEAFRAIGVNVCKVIVLENLLGHMGPNKHVSKILCEMQCNIEPLTKNGAQFTPFLLTRPARGFTFHKPWHFLQILPSCVFVCVFARTCE